MNSFACKYKDCCVEEIPSPSVKNSVEERDDGAISPAKQIFVCSFETTEEARTFGFWLCMCNHTTLDSSHINRYRYYHKGLTKKEWT